jgi:hypothetical protein
MREISTRPEPQAESTATAGADVDLDHTRFSSKGHLPPVAVASDTAPTMRSPSERAFGDDRATAGDDVTPGTVRIPGASLWAKDADGKDLPPSVADVMQGSVADCFLFAAMAAIVNANPERIQELIQDNGDGTYTVSLKGMGLSDTATTHTVKAEFVIGKHGRAAPGRMALWPLIVEKAYAEEKGGIDVLDKGGNPGTAVQDLTGDRARWFKPADREPDELLGTLSAAVKQNHPITCLAPGKDSATDEIRALMSSTTGLYLWHAYTVLDVDVEGRRVKVFNPWGRDHPGGDGWIDVDLFRAFYIEVDINAPSA